MPRILLEGDTFEFVPDRKKITEAVTAGHPRLPVAIPGRFSVCDTINGNNRIYPRKVWERNLKEGSQLQEAITKRRSLGLLEHPKDGNISLLSPISHLVTRATFLEGAPAGVDGEITLINTAEGHKMMALIEAGYNPLVSSRGYGSVEKNESGIDVVQDDYICEAWDLVFNPSFKVAELTPNRAPAPAGFSEGLVPVKTVGTPEQIFAEVNAHINAGRIRADSVRLEGGIVVLESQADSVTDVFNRLHAAYLKKTLPVGMVPSLESNQVTVTDGRGAKTVVRSIREADALIRESQSQPPVAPAQPTSDTIMDLKTIRESMNSLRSTDASKLTPQRLAEGLTQMHALNREAAAVAAADPKLSWDASRVHEDLRELETAWTTAAAAPSASVVKLQEQQVRTTRLLKETCVIGIKYRNGLVEAEKKLAHKGKVVEEVTRRGNGWRQRALRAESRGGTTTKRLNLAYASLDEFTRRYHEDTTKLARHALMLEHKGKIEADATLLKRVNEATKVTQLNVIKEELTGKKTAPVAAPTAAVPVAPAAPAPVAPAAAAPAAPAITVESVTRPFSWNESVGMTQRLSAASAALNG